MVSNAGILAQEHPLETAVGQIPPLTKTLFVMDIPLPQQQQQAIASQHNPVNIVFFL
jgi:hypothetical protein